MSSKRALGPLSALGIAAAAALAIGWFQPAPAPPTPQPNPQPKPQLGPEANWCEVEGQILTPSGRPFAGARLYAEHDGAVSGAGYADEQGRYRIRSGNCDFDVYVLMEDEVLSQKRLEMTPGEKRELNITARSSESWQGVF